MKSVTITEGDVRRGDRSEVRLMESERAKRHSLYNLQVVPQNRNVCLLFKTGKHSLSLLKYEALSDFLSIYTQWSSQHFYLVLAAASLQGMLQSKLKAFWAPESQLSTFKPPLPAKLQLCQALDLHIVSSR